MFIEYFFVSVYEIIFNTKFSFAFSKMSDDLLSCFLDEEKKLRKFTIESLNNCLTLFTFLNWLMRIENT